MLFFQYVGTAEACLKDHDWQLLREVLGGEREEVVEAYIRQLSQPGGQQVTMQAVSCAAHAAWDCERNQHQLHSSCPPLPAGALTAALNWYRANFHAQVFGATQLQPYPLIRCPVLGLWSTGDKALLEEQMLASQLYVEPGCWSYARVQGAGHWIPRDAPQELNTWLLRFLKQEEGCGGAGGAGGDDVVVAGVARGAGNAGSAVGGLGGGEVRAARAERVCSEGCGTPRGGGDGEAVLMAARGAIRSRL
jgi:hypothetical protein